MARRILLSSARSSPLSVTMAAVLLLLTILWGRGSAAGRKTIRPVLFACTASGSVLFEEPSPAELRALQSDENPFPDAIDVWSQKYEEQVSAIVDEYLEPVENCDARTADQALLAPRSLRTLAAQMPAFKDAGEIKRADIGVVLLEYLRMYKCAMTERSYYLPTAAAREMMGVLDEDPLAIMTLNMEMLDQEERIAEETAVAQRTTERVLGFMATLERLRILDVELECLQRISLDIRNGLALSAETSMCLPRVWNAKDPLRDPLPGSP